MVILGFTMTAWTAVGFFGQFLFGSRFLLQWIASEKARTSVIPVAFWYCSIGGGMVLLAYAIHKKDPVFIMGQGLGLAIYFRNLYFVTRKRRKEDGLLAPDRSQEE